MQLVITGTNISFPQRCACCGDPADTSCDVSDTNIGGGFRTTSSWLIPYCRQCVEHVRAVEIGVGTFLLFFFSLGFYYLQYRLIWKPRREKRARAMCKSHCSNVNGVRYTFDKDGGRHGFVFPSDDYARDFARANSEHLVNPSPQIVALLGE